MTCEQFFFFECGRFCSDWDISTFYSVYQQTMEVAGMPNLSEYGSDPMEQWHLPLLAGSFDWKQDEVLVLAVALVLRAGGYSQYIGVGVGWRINMASSVNLYALGLNTSAPQDGHPVCIWFLQN